MQSSIFLIDADNRVVELQRSDYLSEEVFQTLLAEHPDILRLAGGPEGRLLLIRREKPIPDQQEGNDRWSLDHLFVDSEGVPVLVEVKQARDTRSRREVVAQMLDYAANGVAYWSIEQIISAFVGTAEASGEDPEQLLFNFLSESDPESFWRQVEANLRSGRIRMLFVADQIPKELARIVEFLNEQMRPAEVLAIEIAQYRSASGARTIVPRLVGSTERARTAKSIAGGKDILSEQEWLQALGEEAGREAKEGAEKAVRWFRESGFDVGLTRTQAALSASLVRGDGKFAWPFFICRNSARLELSLQYLAEAPQYQDEAARLELLEKMKSIRAASFKATSKLTGWPSIEVGEFLNDTVWTAFADLALEVKQKLQSSNQ